MKVAVICAICSKPKRESDTYMMKLTDYKATPIILDSSKNKYTYPQYKVRVCKTDARRMGYKVKSKKAKVI